MVEVMKAVGLTHGGFYVHFEDKTVAVRLTWTHSSSFVIVSDRR